MQARTRAAASTAYVGPDRRSRVAAISGAHVTQPLPTCAARRVRERARREKRRAWSTNQQKAIVAVVARRLQRRRTAAAAPFDATTRGCRRAEGVVEDGQQRAAVHGAGPRRDARVEVVERGLGAVADGAGAVEDLRRGVGEVRRDEEHLRHRRADLVLLEERLLEAQLEVRAAERRRRRGGRRRGARGRGRRGAVRRGPGLEAVAELGAEEGVDARAEDDEARGAVDDVADELVAAAAARRVAEVGRRVELLVLGAVGGVAPVELAVAAEGRVRVLEEAPAERGVVVGRVGLEEGPEDALEEPDLAAPGEGVAEDVAVPVALEARERVDDLEEVALVRAERAVPRHPLVAARAAAEEEGLHERLAGGEVDGVGDAEAAAGVVAAAARAALAADARDLVVERAVRAAAALGAAARARRVVEARGVVARDDLGVLGAELEQREVEEVPRLLDARRDGRVERRRRRARAALPLLAAAPPGLEGAGVPGRRRVDAHVRGVVGPVQDVDAAVVVVADLDLGALGLLPR